MQGEHAMLKLIDIKKSFDDQIILRGVTFDAKPGKLTVLLGQNGAGKSTLFNIIAGTILQDQGHIMLNDVRLSALPAQRRAQHIAILKQDPKSSTASSLSVFDNLALALLKGKTATLKSASSKDIKHKIIVHMTDLGLDTSLLDRPMGSLSGGQRQILAFAMATIHRPELLLLDEPTAALDEKACDLLMDLVKRFIEIWQIPAVMICHDRGLVNRYADHHHILRDGLITMAHG
jgi:putative tryptophan/tyrosine transport system ATP-binding protein